MRNHFRYIHCSKINKLSINTKLLYFNTIYIDLLLFNIKYNCYVVIELKVCKLKKEHIGQIEVYMNYIDKHIKSINQDKTIGIIISRRDNHYYIEYSSDNRIYTRDYVIS